MIYKAIGAAAVIIAGGALGISKANEYKTRVEYLQSMENCVSLLENEIRYAQTPLWNAFKNVSINSHEIIKSIFLSAGADDHSGKTAAELWKNAVEENGDALFGDDKTLLASFGDCISNYDVDGQLKSLRMFSARLSRSIENAVVLHEKNKKLFKNLGLYSGILIAVLFV